MINGLLLSLVALDLVHRARRRRLGPGFFVLAVGATAAWVPMLALADYWVTSPSAGSAVLALTLVTVAYLVDAIGSDHEWVANASVSVVTAVLIVMLRPTMVVFVVAVIAVLAARVLRTRGILAKGSSRAAGLVAVVSVAAAAAISARDYILSGWLHYPSHCTPSRSTDPRPTPSIPAQRHWEPRGIPRICGTPPTVGAGSGHGWGGFRISGRPTRSLPGSSWLPSSCCWRAARGPRWRGLLVAMIPSVLAVAFWWTVTPPAFRFIWGPLFTVGCLAIPIVAVTLFSGAQRSHADQVTQVRQWRLGISVPYAVAPITTPTVVVNRLSDGQGILQPTESDQCWAVFPLCTPQLLSDVAMRGDSIQEGFAP